MIINVWIYLIIMCVMFVVFYILFEKIWKVNYSTLLNIASALLVSMFFPLAIVFGLIAFVVWILKIIGDFIYDWIEKKLI